METPQSQPIFAPQEKSSFFKRQTSTPSSRSSTRSSIRASPASFLSLTRKGKRYDQLESDFDHLEINQNFAQPGEIESEQRDLQANHNSNDLKCSTQYMTLINEHNSEENLFSFENKVFESPSDSVGKTGIRRRTPPPIPARRLSGHSESEMIRENRLNRTSNEPFCFSEARTSSGSLRNSPLLVSSGPLPVLPAPPSGRRNSRKDRKRPETLSRTGNGSVSSRLSQTTLGEKIFPPEKSSVDSTGTRRSPVCLNPNNPFLPHNSEPNKLTTSTTFSSISQHEFLTQPKSISSSFSTPDYQSLLSTYGGCDFRKSEADSSDDGSSFLLPLSASSSLSTKGASTRNSSSLKRLSNRLSENAYSDTEIGNPNSRNFRSENNSDFEVTDLDLERFDSDSAEIDSKLAVGSRTNLFQGSTNNLADFESNELDLGGARARPDTLEISRMNPFVVDSTEKISPDTPTPCSSQSQPLDLESDRIIESDPFAFAQDNFPTAQLLQSHLGSPSQNLNSSLALNRHNSNQSVFSAFIKLPRVRRRRIRSRIWRPVQINLSSGTLQIFSEDARLIETVALHQDEQLSKVYVDDCEDGIFYVVKLLRVAYRSKKSWGDGFGVRGYSEYRAHESGFSKHVSKSRQILKIATSQYSQIHNLARAMSVLLLNTNQISQDFDSANHLPFCRIIVEVCDFMNCSVNENMEIVSEETSVECSLHALTFGAEKVTIAFNDHLLKIENFERKDLVCSAPDCVVQPKDILSHSCVAEPNSSDGFYLTRAVNFSPTNNMRVELMRFTFSPPIIKMPVLLKSEYSMIGKCLSISCSLHFDQELLIEAVEAIVIRLPLAQSWKVNLSDEAIFTSTTVGNCETEGDWLVWRINRITVQSVESRRQQFLSFSFKGFNGNWDRAQNFAFLEFETSSATVSGTRLRAIKIQSQKDPEEHEKLINYRSHYSARVAIRLVMS